MGCEPTAPRRASRRLPRAADAFYDRSRMTRRILWAALCAVSALAGCRGRPDLARRLPNAIAIELGTPGPAVDAALSARLSAMGAESFFLPAVAATAVGESVAFAPVAGADPSALPGAVYLEVSGTGDFDPALARDPRKVVAALWDALAPAVGRPSPRVAGVHLAWRVRGSAEGYASVIEVLRRRLPSQWTLSVSVDVRLPEEARKRWGTVARKADFLVANVFGRRPDVAPEGFRLQAALEDLADLGVPVYAGFAPQGWGVVRTPGAVPGPIVPDGAISGLSRDRGFDFSFGDVLSDPDEDVYVFTAKREARVPRERTVPAGSTVTFRERRVSDLVRSLAEAKAAPGKVIRLASLSAEGHLFGVKTLEDLLLGRDLRPGLAFSVRNGGAVLQLVALNPAATWSSLSRLNNWIDLRVDGARVLDVRPGEFDRFLFLDERGRPVTAARARTVRLFVNFVGPGEAVGTGPLRVSGRPALFASAHLTLPDGKLLAVAESPVGESAAGVPSAGEQGANGVEGGARRERQPVERKPRR